MHHALIVGGDYIEGIKDVLTNHGIQDIQHWSGRKPGDSRKVIPQNIDTIVLITNWINHSFTAQIKNVAAKRGINVIYTRNGAESLRMKLSSKSSFNTILENACRETLLIYSNFKIQYLLHQHLANQV